MATIRFSLQYIQIELDVETHDYIVPDEVQQIRKHVLYKGLANQIHVIDVVHCMSLDAYRYPGIDELLESIRLPTVPDFDGAYFDYSIPVTAHSCCFKIKDDTIQELSHYRSSPVHTNSIRMSIGVGGITVKGMAHSFSAHGPTDFRIPCDRAWGRIIIDGYGCRFDR